MPPIDVQQSLMCAI